MHRTRVRKNRVLVMLLVCAFITPTIFMLPGTSAEGEVTLFVDADNCPNVGDGTSGDPYCSINDAVSASSSGDTIVVEAGTYVLTSSIEIHHPLTVNGIQSGDSALSGWRAAGGNGESIIDLRGGYGGFLITSSDVSVDGFELLGDENTRWGFYVSGGSGDISNIEIANNIIHGMAKKQDALRSTSWGILTDAVGSGQVLHTIDGLHIHGNHIYDIGGYDDSIGLGISIHEVVSSEEDGGALIENNRFANIHDGKWGGADVPGMGVFTHEQTTMYPGDYLGGITLQNNAYANISVGAALQVSTAGVFDEQQNDFQDVDVFMINVGHATNVNEQSLAPFAKSTGQNISLTTSYGVGGSTAYFASPSAAVQHTLIGSGLDSHSILLSDGVFDESLIIAPTSSEANLLVASMENSLPTFTGGLLMQSNHLMNNITIDGITLLGEGAADIALSIDASAGVSDLTIRDMVIDASNVVNTRSGIVCSGLSGTVIIDNNQFINLDGAFSFTTTPGGTDDGAGSISALQFSDNSIIDSESSVNIEPVIGSITNAQVMGNVFIDSGVNSTGNDNTPMLTIRDASILYLADNHLQNIYSAQAIFLQDVRYITAADNNLSNIDSAITIDESIPNTIEDVIFEDNSFTQIDTSAIDVSTLGDADVSIEDNWFGTTNMSDITNLIQGDTEIGSQWNSWPGNDSDGDGWSDEFDLCEGYNDVIDIDNDGIPDGCDDIIDRDADGTADWLDNCPFTSNPTQADHDGDLQGDVCDDNDDNDQKIDDIDSCPLGDLGWAPSSINDYDNDGCYDMNEDTDDDGDGIADEDDNCPTNMQWGWTSNATNDIDSDGCKDLVEDDDDDGDGKNDSVDQCPLGNTNWTSDQFTDMDRDGCRDFSEDDDDDGDGVADASDACPLVSVSRLDDEDRDGCVDGASFTELFMQGDSVAMATVFIPLLIIFALGMVLYIRQGRVDSERRLRDILGAAEKPMQLRNLSKQAVEMFSAKLITSTQHDEIQDDIRQRLDEFSVEEVGDSDEVSKGLNRIFSKAMALGLTTKDAVKRMKRHIENGRFTPEHYLEMWTERIEQNETKSDTNEDSPSEDTDDSDDDGSQFTLSTPAGWPTSKSGGASSKPTKSVLNRMKKAELVDLAKAQGVSHSGTKAQIIDSLLEEE
jgi:hypothetical protein